MNGHKAPRPKLIAALVGNWVGLFGLLVATCGLFAALCLIAIDFFHGFRQPYMGILVYLIVPSFVWMGLIFMGVGVWLELRRRKKPAEAEARVEASGARRTRQLATALAAVFLFLMLSALGSYRAFEVTESPQFCGALCHTVMKPEYTAYKISPHSRVRCTECHIGPGASWFVRSKLSGTRQLFAVAFHTYSRPIPSPVKYLRPARETCEQCHWPQRFTGDKFLVKEKFQDDEKNTKLTTVLVLKIGGVTWQGRVGIHGRHLETASRIHYISIDPERMIIPVVNYVTDTGKTITFVSSEIKTTPEQLAKGEHREMDCVDCHNRPTHTFEMPESAVDKQMATGQISPELPFVKKKAVELLKANYPDREAARQSIIQGLDDFYRTGYPQVYATRGALVQQSAEEIAAIYSRNIFPSMRLDWGTHPNNIGHMESPGCFRCHDGSHTSADGQTIPNDCSTCHSLLAMEEPNPKVLAELGMN